MLLKISYLLDLNVYIITIIFITIIVYIQWRWSIRRMCNMAEKIPMTNVGFTLPFLGHGHYFIGSTEKIMTSIIRFANGNSPSRFWLGPKLIFLVTRPEDVEIVFNSQNTLKKYELYEFGKCVIGEGLLTAQVPIWRNHRKIILPTFNQKILNSFASVFASQIEIFLKIIEKHGNSTYDIDEPLSNCILDIVCETSMGVKVNAQTSGSKFAHCLTKTLELVTERIFNPIMHPKFIYMLTPAYKEQTKLTDYLTEFTLKVIEEKKKAFFLRKQELDTNVDGVYRKAFLDMLIELSENGKQFTDVELRDEVATFLVAGMDTSSSVIGFSIMMLAMYPDIQEKVYSEIIEISGQKTCIDFNDLNKFKYMDLVIKETMRLFPVGPLVVREVEEDLKLEKYTLPKGSGVAILTIGTHRSPEYYKNPLTFDPDRFLPEEIAKRHAYSYYPFTGGPRKCIGLKYGMMLVKYILAELIRKYSVETDYNKVEDIRLKETLVLKPVKGFPVRTKKRNS